MKKLFLIPVFLLLYQPVFCWGFFGHQKINYYALFLLPPEMIIFYKKHIDFLSEHAVDPDKRRYAVEEEAPRHYIDINHYGDFPYTALPRVWDSAVNKFGRDSVNAYGIVPWWIQTMQQRLTKAFRDKDAARILKLSAEIGHYIADAHVPLHACNNHNGQLTGQKGIHAFWESRIPELLADKEWDFFIGKASYVKNIGQFSWARVLESAAAADSVLKIEKKLSADFPTDLKYAFEERNGVLIRQYSTAYTLAYNQLLTGMVERRMRQSIYAVASFWYTAWVNAGQPDLKNLEGYNFGVDDLKDLDSLSKEWKNGSLKNLDCD